MKHLRKLNEDVNSNTSIYAVYNKETGKYIGTIGDNYCYETDDLSKIPTKSISGQRIPTYLSDNQIIFTTYDDANDSIGMEYDSDKSLVIHEFSLQFNKEHKL